MQKLNNVFLDERIVIDSHAVVMSVHPGENTRTARATQRRGDVGIGEGCAFVEDARPGARHEVHRVVPLVIADDEQDIRPAVGGDPTGGLAGLQKYDGYEHQEGYTPEGNHGHVLL